MCKIFIRKNEKKINIGEKQIWREADKEEEISYTNDKQTVQQKLATSLLQQ